jgi:hypothetical protein
LLCLLELLVLEELRQQAILVAAVQGMEYLMALEAMAAVEIQAQMAQPLQVAVVADGMEVETPALEAPVS